MIPDKLMRKLQELIDETINLDYDDAIQMLDEIINDAEDAKSNLEDEYMTESEED